MSTPVKQIKLSNVLTEIIDKTEEDGKYRVLTSSQSGIVSQEEYFNKKVASRDTSGYKIIRKGQFTYRAMSDTGRFYINRLDDFDIGIVSPAYPVFEIKDDNEVSSDYLTAFFKSEKFQSDIAHMYTGSTRASLKFKNLRDVVINVPDKEEQKKRLNVLRIIDRELSILGEIENKLDDFVKSRFIEMFGDPLDNPFGLPELTLPELGEFGRGVSKHRPRNDPKLLGGNYPLIQTGDVATADLFINSYESTYSELGLKQSKMWKKGTLCITIAANIAKTAILGFDACFPDSVVGFNANEKTSNIFVHYWFSFFQAILEAKAPESAQKNINLKILSELKVITPPIEKQNEFIKYVQQVDKSKLAIYKIKKHVLGRRLAT